jgi:hypothetical protein
MQGETTDRWIGLDLLDPLDRGEFLGELAGMVGVTLEPMVFEPYPPGDGMDDVKPVRGGNTLFRGVRRWHAGEGLTIKLDSCNK